jgi:hypothetical protein
MIGRILCDEMINNQKSNYSQSNNNVNEINRLGGKIFSMFLLISDSSKKFPSQSVIISLTH